MAVPSAPVATRRMSDATSRPRTTGTPLKKMISLNALRDDAEEVGVGQDPDVVVDARRTSAGPMPFQRSVEYCDGQRSGTRTNAAYAMRAGRTNSQPAQRLLRTPRQREVRSEPSAASVPPRRASR